ncbi:MAG TPA: glycosyltransferase, partial [Acidothermaceae bacterium]|nr:glycosyltransferase [Acidothermaceae bacterium]
MARRQPVPHSDAEASAVDICVVGSGTKFVSGISYYTYHLSSALARRRVVSVVLMRSLIPKRFYPGRARVGAPITDLSTRSFAATFDGIDWFAVPSVPRAMRFFVAHPPKVVVFQWWSGSVLPWYLLLARAAQRRGATIIIEFHEDLDTGEAAIPLLGSLIRRGLRSLVRQASGYVVHSQWDADRLCASLSLDRERVGVIPHGPFPMGSGEASAAAEDSRRRSEVGDAASVASIPRELTILFFGTIRPYKGLEYLVEAFDRLPRDGATRWRLLIVGETWEGWTRPLTMVSESPYRDDIELINRYVSDDEIP